MCCLSLFPEVCHRHHSGVSVKVASTSLESCPAVTHKNHKRLFCTVSLGEPRVLQPPDSDVSLSIPQGVPGVYIMTVHTDITNFLSSIPEDECIVAPVVEVVSVRSGEGNLQNTPNVVYIINVPHCRSAKVLAKSLNIRRFGLQEASGTNLAGTCEVGDLFLRFKTTQFSVFVCTSGEHSCDAEILVSIFGKLNPFPDEGLTTVDVKAFLLSELYKINDVMHVSFQSKFLKLQHRVLFVE